MYKIMFLVLMALSVVDLVFGIYGTSHVTSGFNFWVSGYCFGIGFAMFKDI